MIVLSEHWKTPCFERATRSLAMFVHSHRSLGSLAPQRSASLHSRARSLTSLTPSWDGWNSLICVHAVIAFHRNKRVLGRHQKHALTNKFEDKTRILYPDLLALPIRPLPIAQYTIAILPIIHYPYVTSHNELVTESRTLIWKWGQSGPISLKHDFVLQWNWSSCFSGLTHDHFLNCNEIKSQSSLSL